MDGRVICYTKIPPLCGVVIVVPRFIAICNAQVVQQTRNCSTSPFLLLRLLRSMQTILAKRPSRSRERKPNEVEFTFTTGSLSFLLFSQSSIRSLASSRALLEHFLNSCRTQHGLAPLGSMCLSILGGGREEWAVLVG